MARWLRGVACACVITLSWPSAADDGAREAYDRATRAYDAGDYAAAARDYARADELEPHAVALRWAITAATRADDAVLAMTLVRRAGSRPGDADLAAAVSDAEARFADRVGTVLLRCPPAVACSARLDGAEALAGVERVVLVGQHHVVFEVNGASEERTFDVGPRAHVAVEASTPLPVPAPAPALPPSPPLPPPAAPIAPEAGGIHPAWLFVGTGVTVGLGAALLWSGVDTLDKHDAYLATRDQASFDDGQAAELRTNLLIGATAAAAAATALVAIFAVDWGGTEVAVAPGGVVVGGRF